MVAMGSENPNVFGCNHRPPNSVRKWRKAMGRFSSSRIVFTGEFQEFHGIFTFYGGEMFEKEFERIAGRQIVEQGLGHNAGLAENQSPTEDAGIGLNGAVIQNHHADKIRETGGEAMMIPKSMIRAGPPYHRPVGTSGLACPTGTPRAR